MPKLNDVLKSSPGMSVERPGSKIIFMNKYGYTPKPDDEKKFVGIHAVVRHNDPAGNGDELFKGIIKPYDREKNRMGYNNHDDEKAEFAADKGAEKQEIAAEELEEQYEALAAEINETTIEAATRMAQELSNHSYRPHFVHSYVPDYKYPEKRRYGVISVRHYNNDENRHWDYHLDKIVHPEPIKPIKFNKSSKKAIRTMKEDAERAMILRGGKTGTARNDNPGATKFKSKRPSILATSSRGNSEGGFKSSANDNKSTGVKRPMLRLVKNEDALNEIGDTPEGRSKLRRYGAKAHAQSQTPFKGKYFNRRMGIIRSEKRIHQGNLKTQNKAIENIKARGHLKFEEETEGSIDERQWHRFAKRRAFVKPPKVEKSEKKSSAPANKSVPQNNNGITLQDSRHSVNEVLAPNSPAKAYIDDVLKSDRYQGKSKKEKIRIGLGWFYHNHNKGSSSK